MLSAIKTILPFLFLFGIVGQIYAQDILVVTEDYPPFNFKKDGKITGSSTEVVKAVLKKAKINYKLKLKPWTRAYKEALTKKNILIFSISRSDQREKLFKWVGVIAPNDNYLYALKSSKIPELSKLDMAKKYKIGVVKDDVSMQYLEKEGFKQGKSLIVDRNYVISFKKLLKKKVQLIPLDLLGGAVIARQCNSSMKKLKKIFFLKDISKGLYMAFSNKTPDSIVEKCKKALEEIKKDGTYEKILSKYIQ